MFVYTPALYFNKNPPLKMYFRMSKALALLALLLSLLAVHLFYIPSPSTEQLKSLRDTVVVICGASSGKGSTSSLLRSLCSDAQRVHPMADSPHKVQHHRVHHLESLILGSWVSSLVPKCTVLLSPLSCTLGEGALRPQRV